MRSLLRWSTQVAIVVVVCAVAGKAKAAQYYSPFGSAYVEAYIGTDPNDGNSQWIGWKSGGSCYWNQIGDGNGIWDYTSVFPGSGGSFMSIVPSGGVTFCGYYLDPPLYNGERIDIWGGAGDDYHVAYGGDTHMDGYTGNDVLISYRFDAYVNGDGGNDHVFAYGSGSGGWYLGGSGNDCVQVASTLSFDTYNTTCGSGTDSWGGLSSVRPSDCENQVSNCTIIE